MQRLKTNFIILLSAITIQIKAADTVFIYNYRALNENSTLYNSVLSFQGLINRHGPKLLIQFNSEDYLFTEILSDHFPEYVFIDIKSEHDLFTHPGLKQYCNKAFYYRESTSVLTQNCAVTFAGIHDAVMVEESAVTLFNKFGFNIIADKREETAWSTLDSCSAWLLNTAKYENTINKHFYGVAEGSNGRNKAVDFMIQQRMVCFLLDSYGVNSPITHFNQYQVPYLKLYPPFSVSHGWWSKEVKDIEAISKFGHTSANQGENVSFWNKLPIKGDIIQRADTAVIPSYDPSKTYLFFTFSQGDGMRYCQRTNFDKYMHKNSNGEIVSKTLPFGLMQSTIQLDIQRFIPYFHYKNISENNFRVMFSGKGYGYSNLTSLSNHNFLDGYAERSVDYLFRSGMVDLMINDNLINKDNDNEILKDYISKLEYKPRSIIFKHGLNDQDDEDDEAWVFDNVPVFADPVMAINTSEGDLVYNEMVEAIYNSMQKRKFFYVFLKHPNNVEEVENLKALLVQDPRFNNLVILHPEQFIKLYRSFAGLEEYINPYIPQEISDKLTLTFRDSLPYNLSWTPVENESRITHYMIWYLDRDQHKIGQSIAKIPAGTHSYTFGSDSEIPFGAESIGLFSSWNGINAFQGTIADTLKVSTIKHAIKNSHRSILYPNPTEGIVNLRGIKKAHITLYDPTGKIQFSEWIRDGSANLISLSDGIYFVTIFQENGSYFFEKLQILK